MTVATDEKINWFRVIVDLCNLHGYTHKSIAIAVGSEKNTVRGWKMGATPRYEDGERLIALWVQVTGHEITARPMQRRYPTGHDRRRQ